MGTRTQRLSLETFIYNPISKGKSLYDIYMHMVVSQLNHTTNTQFVIKLKDIYIYQTLNVSHLQLIHFLVL